MKDLYFYLDFVRRIKKKLFGTKRISFNEFIFEDVELKGQAVSDLIKNKINSGEPFLVSRLGTELYSILNYKEVRLGKIKKIFKYINDDIYYLDWKKYNMDYLCSNTGFFPNDQSHIERYCELAIQNMKDVDIWGQWQNIEKLFKLELGQSLKISLFDIEPFFHNNPWTQALKDKKVLVIHPFAESINSQYLKRDMLFTNKKILPEFKLITLKAVQSLGGINDDYNNWFEALDFLKQKIEKSDFDIALIGCGSYGLPLGSFIKNLGKQAIHMGGATQLLFGIIGARWEKEPRYQHLINNSWERPYASEKPPISEKIEEDCCYW